MKFPDLIVRCACTLVLAAVTGAGFSQKSVSPAKWYADQWAKVDAFEKRQLPRSADSVTAIIHAKALKEQQTGEAAKSLMHRLKFQKQFSDNGWNDLYGSMQAETNTAWEPYVQVLHSMMAETIQQYYAENQWRVSNVKSNGDSTSLETMGTRQLAASFALHLNQSLLNTALLAKTQASSLPQIIEPGNRPVQLRPTLWDFLAHRGVDLWASFANGIDLTGEPFEIGAESFLPAERFVALELKADDVLDANFQVSRLWQRILQFRMQFVHEREALLAAELDRLLWVNDHSFTANAAELFAQRLDALAQQSKGMALYSLVIYHQALAKRNYVVDGKTVDLKSVVALFEEGAKAWPKSEGGQMCRRELDAIKMPHVELVAEQTYCPNDKGLFKFDFVNCKKVSVFVFQVDDAAFSRGSNYYPADSLVAWQKASPNAIVFNVDIPLFDDYAMHTTNATLPALKPGRYVLAVSDKPTLQPKHSAVSYCHIHVSTLGVVSASVYGQGKMVTVVNRQSGIPVAGAKVIPYIRRSWRDDDRVRWQGQTDFVTNQDGQVLIPISDEHGMVDLEVRYRDEVAYEWGRWSYGRDFSEAEVSRTKLFIYTDRKIYRPGQSVQFKTVVMDGNRQTSKAVVGQNIDLVLRDANGNDVQKLKLKTNEFGSCSGLFQLPTNVLNGSWSITSFNGSTDFRVEAYKRPKFTVELTPPQGAYKPGDSLEVKGKALSYSGGALDGATVKFKILEKTRNYWMTRHKSGAEVALGTVDVDEKGEFAIRFASSPTVCDRLWAAYYEVAVDVTDLNGETQSANLDVAIAKSARVLTVSTQNVVDLDHADSLAVTVNLTNQAGQPLAGSGTYKIYKMTPNPLKPTLYWEKPEIQLALPYVVARYQYPNDKAYSEQLVDSGRWDNSRTAVVRLANALWMSRGMIKLEFGLDGDTVRLSQQVVLNRSENGPMALAEPLTASLIDATARDQGVAVVLGSAFKQMNVRVLAMVDGKSVLEKAVVLDGNQLVLPLPNGNYLGQTLKLRVWGMNQNRFYEAENQLQFPDTTRQLKVALETFREKLSPGSAETIKIKVGALVPNALPAEMVASMYDASLDTWVPNQWQMNLFYPYYFELPERTVSEFGPVGGLVSVTYPQFESIVDWNYPSFKWFDLLAVNDEVMPMFLAESADQDAPPPRKGAGKFRALPAISNKLSMVSDSVELDKEDVDGGGDSDSKPDELGAVPVRRNLQETAFFYPHLVTDANGDVSLTYTVPESLTKWRFMAMAHNKQGFSGQAMTFAQTTKELMVVPEIPRFFREGDELALSAKIMNLTNDSIVAHATIELVDVLTQQPIAMLQGAANQDCRIKANQSGAVQWWVKVPVGVEAVVVRVKAVGKQHSDGEEQVVPVLPNRILVSESLPIQLVRKGKTVHHLQSLETSKNADHYRLTFRYTQQAAWEVLKALPYLMEYPHECSEQLFSRLFGYAMGRQIVSTQPSIKKALAYWEQQQQSGQTPMASPLMQNDEIKAILLQETPWQQAGENETANRQRLLKLLDDNYTREQIRQAIGKLQEMQLGDGQFAWFKGMDGNSYITQHLMAGFGQLQRMGIDLPAEFGAQPLIDNGVNYLHRQLRDVWSNLSRDTLATFCGGDNLHLLYALSFYVDRPMDAQTSVARDSLLMRLGRSAAKYSVMEQAMTALVYKRFGMSDRAASIMASIDEQAIGRGTDLVHFRGSHSWRWTDNAIETQAMVLEAMSELSPQNPMVLAMQNYLVTQKRAQAWPTTKNTVVAVWSMMSLPALKEVVNEQDAIVVGSVKLNKMDGVKRDALTGSFAVKWDKPQIKPAMGKVVIQKKTDGVAWGALHWQYFAPIADVKATSGVVTIQKALFVEKQTAQGTKLLPVGDAQVNVGDKIVVRLTLSAQEAMDYVHVKDLRSSLLEPVDVLSVYHWQNGLGYYQAVSDASVNFFIGRLPKGNFVLEYTLRVRGKGNTANGFATVECMYAPEFESRSESVILHTN